MFDSQAWFARDYILGKIKPVPKEERIKDMAGWRDRMMAITSSTEAIRYQMEYVKDLKTVRMI